MNATKYIDSFQVYQCHTALLWKIDKKKRHIATYIYLFKIYDIRQKVDTILKNVFQAPPLIFVSFVLLSYLNKYFQKQKTKS